MNRYVVDGIVSDLRAGKSVALLSQLRRESLEAFSEVLRQVEDEVENMSHANGSERCRLKSGGTLRILASGDRGGGLDIGREGPSDVLVCHGWNDMHESRTTLLLTSWRAIGIGEVVRL